MQSVSGIPRVSRQRSEYETGSGFASLAQRGHRHALSLAIGAKRKHLVISAGGWVHILKRPTPGIEQVLRLFEVRTIPVRRFGGGLHQRFQTNSLAWIGPILKIIHLKRGADVLDLDLCRLRLGF